MKAVFRARSHGRGTAAKRFFQANWHLITIGVMAGAILCLAVVLLDTMPPRAIAMATGPTSGGYQNIGKQYQAILARAGERLSPAVRRLITDERVELADAPRADAYIALYPFLSKVTVPRGVGDHFHEVWRWQSR